MTLSHPATNALTEKVIGAALEVHREVGPGMLESTYQEALWIELSDRRIAFISQPLLPVTYKGHKLATHYRPDLIIENQVIVELKSVEKLLDVHRAQVLTYLTHTQLNVGLLFNFNSSSLIKSMSRISR